MIHRVVETVLFGVAHRVAETVEETVLFGVAHRVAETVEATFLFGAAHRVAETVEATVLWVAADLVVATCPWAAAHRAVATSLWAATVAEGTACQVGLHAAEIFLWAALRATHRALLAGCRGGREDRPHCSHFRHFRLVNRTAYCDQASQHTGRRGLLKQCSVSRQPELPCIIPIPSLAVD